MEGTAWRFNRYAERAHASTAEAAREPQGKPG
jgi:hypothetical protein